MIHLLLVDNDPDILELLRVGLESYGYFVRTAESGLEALRAIEDELPDVLITDLIMPNISGEKLLNIVRAVPEWNSLKTIVVSGVAAEAPKIRERIACDIYVAKGPIAGTLKYLNDSINHFERMRTISAENVIGIEEIHSRHITRELLDFKAEIDVIMDQISDGLCRVNGAGTVIWINNAYSTLVGKPEEKILGRNVTHFLDESDQERFLELLYDKERLTIELRVPITGGVSRLVRVTRLVPLAENDPFRTILWQDVTERLLSEEYYENIVESANDIVLTTNLEGQITYTSRSIQRVTGRAVEDVVGRFPWELIPEHDQDATREHFMGTLTRFLDEGSPEHEKLEVPLVRSEGGVRLVEVSLSPFRNRANRIMGIQMVATDVTERRRLEDEREALSHEVQHRVRDNLQLVASLVRLSGPEHVEMRIAAVSEVFDELYREKSFSRIKARPLLERIVSLAVDESPACAGAATIFTIDAEYLPMRTAVPVSLLLMEMIRELSFDGPCCTTLQIGFSAQDEALLLSLECFMQSAETDSAGHETTPPDDGIVSILTSQLRGKCEIVQTESSVRYTIRFIPEHEIS